MADRHIGLPMFTCGHCGDEYEPSWDAPEGFCSTECAESDRHDPAADERIPAPCCGQPRCYCECPAWQQEYAALRARAEMER